MLLDSASKFRDLGVLQLALLVLVAELILQLLNVEGDLDGFLLFLKELLPLTLGLGLERFCIEALLRFQLLALDAAQLNAFILGELKLLDLSLHLLVLSREGSGLLLQARIFGL